MPSRTATVTGTHVLRINVLVDFPVRFIANPFAGKALGSSIEFPGAPKG